MDSPLLLKGFFSTPASFSLLLHLPMSPVLKRSNGSNVGNSDGNDMTAEETTAAIHPFYNRKTAHEKAAAMRRTQSTGCLVTHG